MTPMIWRILYRPVILEEPSSQGKMYCIPCKNNWTTGMSIDVHGPILSKTVYNLLAGLTTNSYSGYNPSSKYYGHPRFPDVSSVLSLTSNISYKSSPCRHWKFMTSGEPQAAIFVMPAPASCPRIWPFCTAWKWMVGTWNTPLETHKPLQTTNFWVSCYFFWECMTGVCEKVMCLGDKNHWNSSLKSTLYQFKSLSFHVLFPSKSPAIRISW